jgi:hypothetical protein
MRSLSMFSMQVCVHGEVVRVEGRVGGRESSARNEGDIAGGQ